MNGSGRLASSLTVGAFRAIAAACALAPCAGAQAQDAHVTVDCTALDAEHRAALEARARSGLIVRHEVGTLVFTCAGQAGAVAWTPASGETSRGEVALPQNADAAIERLLEDAERLLVASHAAAAPAPAPAAAVPVPQPEPPKAALPPVASAAPELEAPAGSSERPPGEGAGLPFGVAAGASIEIWDSVPALGPGMLLRWYAAGQLRLDAGGTLLWSTAERLGITGRLVRFHLGGELAFGEGQRFRVGARVLIDALKANPDAALGVDAATDTSAAARLHAHYAVPLVDTLHLVLGPYLGVRAAPVRVELGSSEAFRIPAITAGAEILLEWDGR
jgi:hypothetical protein